MNLSTLQQIGRNYWWLLLIRGTVSVLCLSHRTDAQQLSDQIPFLYDWMVLCLTTILR
jgi:hypothetical protein